MEIILQTYTLAIMALCIGSAAFIVSVAGLFRR